MRGRFVAVLALSGCSAAEDVVSVSEVPLLGATILHPLEDTPIRMGSTVEAQGIVRLGGVPTQDAVVDWVHEDPKAPAGACQGLTPDVDGMVWCRFGAGFADKVLVLQARRGSEQQSTVSVDLRGLFPNEAPRVQLFLPSTGAAGTRAFVSAEVVDDLGVDQLSVSWSQSYDATRDTPLDLSGLPDHPDAFGMADGWVELETGEFRVDVAVTDGDGATGTARAWIKVPRPGDTAIPPLEDTHAPP